MGVKALTNLRMKVLKMSRSSKLLSVLGTSKNEKKNEWNEFSLFGMKNRQYSYFLTQALQTASHMPSS